MGAVVNRVTFDATGSHKIANAGEGMSDAGWQISVVGHSWTGSGLLKQGTNAPGSPVTVGSALTYYNATSGAASSAAITSATSVIVQDTGSDLYFDYTHTSGTVTITVSAAGTLVGQDDGMLPVFNPAFTGTLTGPAITLSGAFSAASYGATSATTGVFVSSSASALAVGPTGTTNPVFVTDASAGASVLAGLKVTGATSAGTVAVVVQSPGSAASLSINAKGTGTIGIGSVSTGAVTITPATTVTGNLAVGANKLVVTAATGNVVTSGAFTASDTVSIVRAGGGAALAMSGAGLNYYQQTISNSAGSIRFGVESSAGNDVLTGADAYAAYINAQAAGTRLVLATGAVVRMTFASSGNASFSTAAVPTSSAGLSAGQLYSSADGDGIKHVCIV